MRSVSEWLERLVAAGNSSTFVTFRYRPKLDVRRHLSWEPDQRRDTAILLQGPIMEEGNFTAETVARYRHNFPGAPIVVSTWTEYHGSITRSIEDLGAVVVVQETPANPGVSNINLQIASTAAGLRIIQDYDVTHIVKSRTDQRIYSDTALSFLHAISSAFPIDSDTEDQKERLVGMSLNTFVYRMYGLSDMFMFGTQADMCQYWDRPLDSRQPEDAPNVSSHREFAHARLPEVLLCSDFLASTQWDPSWSLADSWAAFAKRFMVVDSHSLDLLWPKYSSHEDRWRSYDGNPQFREIDFGMWLQLYAGSLTPDERILDLRW